MEAKVNQSYERYQKGMALQEGGASAAEIAQAIGLKDAAAWYSTRAYHGGRKLAQRAIPKTENAPEPAAILEGVDCQRTAPRGRGAMLNAKGAEAPMQNAECGMRGAEAPMQNAECGMLNAKEARKIGEDIAEGIKEGASSPDAADAMSAWASAAHEAFRLGAVKPDQIRSSLLPEGTDDERYWPADMLPFNPSLPVTAPRRVAVLRMVCAEGERVRYRLQDGQVNIHAKGQKRCALALSIEEARCMILELTDFLAQTEAMA